LNYKNYDNLNVTSQGGNKFLVKDKIGGIYGELQKVEVKKKDNIRILRTKHIFKIIFQINSKKLLLPPKRLFWGKLYFI